MASLVPRCTLPESGRISPRIRRSNVVLPLPFGPISPTLSPRRIRQEKFFTTCFSAYLLPTCSSSATRRPERSRAACLDALADPDFLLREDLVELALMHGLGFETFRLLFPIGAVVARIRAQVSAVEIDDPQRDRIEEAPVVRDEQHAAREAKQRLFQPFDRGEIEMVGRFVEEEQIGCHDEGARQRHALLQAARELRYGIVFGKLQAAERGGYPVLKAPAVARIERLLQMLHTFHQRDIVLR